MVPEQFLSQDVRAANPPTLLIPLIDHLRLVEEIIYFLNQSDPEEQPSLSVLKLLHSIDDGRLRDRRGCSPLDTKSSFQGYSEAQCHSTNLPSSLLQASGPKCLVKCLFLSDVVKDTYDFVDHYYGHIVKWFNYFKRTQRSKRSFTPRPQHKPVALYRWFQVSAEHALASGFDDAPRGLLVDQNATHLDLQSWMAFMSSSIHTICR